MYGFVPISSVINGIMCYNIFVFPASIPSSNLYYCWVRAHLSRFRPMKRASFHTSWKCHETSGFLMFSGVKKWNIGWKWVKFEYVIVRSHCSVSFLGKLFHWTWNASVKQSSKESKMYISGVSHKNQEFCFLNHRCSWNALAFLILVSNDVPSCKNLIGNRNCIFW